jgi:hypothetical protein
LSNERATLMKKVEKIWDADIYRDGGSYGFCFDADDGRWYEFFLRTAAFTEEETCSHFAPELYLEGCNSGCAVHTFSWTEAKEFVANLSYPNNRFDELVEIVVQEGKMG